jgi:hypothetical protein
VLGSTRAGLVVARVGHIRAFAAFVSLFSASTLSYALAQDPVLWTGLRLIDGLCIAGVYVCLESWLNQRAEAGSRGTVLAAYMIALYIGQAASQFLLNVDGAAPSIPLVAASILISLSALPVALTRIDAPPLTSAATLPIKALYKISPLGTGGAAITGAMLGAFYALGAVYARRMPRLPRSKRRLRARAKTACCAPRHRIAVPSSPGSSTYCRRRPPTPVLARVRTEGL